MSREIEFSAKKMNGNLIKKYSYIRSNEVRIEADYLIVDKKPIYEIFLYLNGDTKPNLKINYPADGVKSSVVESLKTAKDSIITVSQFLELLSSKMDSIEITNSDMVIRGHKKALASEVSLVYHFKDLVLEF